MNERSVQVLGNTCQKTFRSKVGNVVVRQNRTFVPVAPQVHYSGTFFPAVARCRVGAVERTTEYAVFGYKKVVKTLISD